MENLEFRQLEIFCEVVRLGSFSRAAQKVHLSQASVSERIAALEDQVGCRLFDRSPGRGVRPTRVGQALYQRAIRLLRDREIAAQELRDLLGVRRGTLSIGASTVPGTYHLPQVLGQFSTQVPDATFSLSIVGSEQVLDGVADGTFELGISGEPSEGGQAGGRLRSAVGHTRLWQDTLLLAVPAGHPLGGRERVRLPELADLPFVLREPGSGTRRWTDLYLQQELPGGLGDVKVVAEVDNLGALKQAVIHGLGVSVMSASAIQAELASGLLHGIELEGASITRWFYLVRDERRTPSPLAQLFTRALLEAAGATDTDGTDGGTDLDV